MKINILEYKESIQNNKICEEEKNKIASEIINLKNKKQRLINLIKYISINLDGKK